VGHISKHVLRLSFETGQSDGGGETDFKGFRGSPRIARVGPVLFPLNSTLRVSPPLATMNSNCVTSREHRVQVRTGPGAAGNLARPVLASDPALRNSGISHVSVRRSRASCLLPASGRTPCAAALLLARVPAVFRGVRATPIREG
jgi:hypothetical protein